MPRGSEDRQPGPGSGGYLRGSPVIGDWPMLANHYAGRDLLSTRSVRTYIGWVMCKVFGIGRAEVEGAVFPRRDLGPDLRLI